MYIAPAVLHAAQPPLHERGHRNLLGLCIDAFDKLNAMVATVPNTRAVYVAYGDCGMRYMRAGVGSRDLEAEEDVMDTMCMAWRAASERFVWTSRERQAGCSP